MKNILITILILLLFACKEKDELKIIEKDNSIISLKYPTSINLGEKIKIEIQYFISNGCGEFVRNDLIINNKALDLRTIIAYKHSSNSVCNTQVIESSTFTEFTPTEKGIYTIQYKNIEGKILNNSFEVK